MRTQDQNSYTKTTDKNTATVTKTEPQGREVCAAEESLCAQRATVTFARAHSLLPPRATRVGTTPKEP
jgi:hypothetical protein